MSNFNSRSFTIEGDDGDIDLDILNEDDRDVTLKDAIIDLYLNVKIRNSEDIDNYNEDKLKDERDQLKDIDSFAIIEYIKSSIEILLSLKLEEQEKELKKGADEKTHSHHHHKKQQQPISNFNQNSSSIVDFFSDQSSYRVEPPQEYETQLQKLEGDVRNHIRIEQQLKIHLDNVLQKLEDQEKLQILEQQDNQDRIKELKKDKERLEELLSLREREINELKNKLDNFDSNTLKEKSDLQHKLKALELEYNTKLQLLQKELEDSKMRIKSLSEKRTNSQLKSFSLQEREDKDDLVQIRRKLTENNEAFDLIENSSKISKKNRNLSRGQITGINMTQNPQSYVLSSTGSTNNLQQNELNKFRSMKEMLKMKNDHIKLYKDSFPSKAKSRSPSKYQSSDNTQILANSNSQSNLHSINNSHKRSHSQNMTSSNIKSSSAYDGQQKNLLQQYNNYVLLKPGNSRTAGQMSLNMTQSMQLNTGQSTDNYKLIPHEEISEQILTTQQPNFFQPSFVSLYLGGSTSNPSTGAIQNAHQRHNSSGIGGQNSYNKKLVSKQHQNYSMALNSSGNNTGRGAAIQKSGKKASYGELNKQLSQSQLKFGGNNINSQNIPTKQYQNQQQQLLLQQQQQQLLASSQSQQYIKPTMVQQPVVILSGNASNSHLQGFNPVNSNKQQIKKKRVVVENNLLPNPSLNANVFKQL